MKKYSNLLLLLSASSGIIAANAGCTFCKENAANGGAVSFDLSTLPSGTFTVMSPAPREVSYYISSPCENAVAPVTQCCGLQVHSSGIQGEGSCYNLGLLQSNSTIDLVDGGNSGFNLTLYGSGEPGTKSCGSVHPPLWGHRASKYQFICDKDAPTNNVPTMVEEEVGCEYTIQWRHPAACPKQVGSTCPGQPLPPTPPEPSPTNSSNCQPHWKPTWDMKRSTILYACNASGFHDVQKAIQYGVVVYDWSNAKAIWANQHPMNDEELLTKQAEMVLAADPGIPGEQQRVWVYRNTIKALNWYTAVREKLDDPAYEGWFIKFKDYQGPSSNNSYHVPACTYEKCSGFYHDQEQTPEYPKGDGSCKEECDCGKAPCGEYIFDHRNASFADWYVNEYMISNETLLHKPIPIGLGWMDDSMKITGPTEENKYFINDTGSTPKEMQDMVAAYQRNKEYFHQRVIESGGWTWQLTHHGGSGVAGLNSTQKDQCAQTLRGSWCTPAGPDEWKATQRYEVKADDVTSRSTDITAEFLLTRGDYAWIGYGWLGCAGTDWPRASEWDQDYGGKAIGSCAETGDSTGVFQREYPKAVVEWDCNEAKGSIRMK